MMDETYFYGDAILKINSSKCKKFTLGGCFVEKINETVLITREN